jgi:DNA repair protein SbcC/Rad50
LILNRIALKNIRSYKEETPIDIPKGITLFEGDVGSGKSTILSAIEFALFGIGDVKGSDLLRHGAKNGSVRLEFEANGKQCVVFRSLERGSKKNVSQSDDGYIEEDGLKTDYSTTEMKVRILKIIGVKEKASAKTSSLIYRFAFYTPQEDMKRILEEDDDVRLETLRRAFGIEEYSIAANNSDIVGRWFKEEIKLKKEVTKALSQIREDFKSESAVFKAKEKEREEIGNEIGKLSSQIKIIEDRMKELEPRAERILEIEKTLPRLQMQIDSEANSLVRLKTALTESNKQLNEVMKAESLLVQLKPGYDQFGLDKDELRRLGEQVKVYERATKDKEKIEHKIEMEKSGLESRIPLLEREVSMLDLETGKDREDIADFEALSNEVEQGQKLLVELPGFRDRSLELLTKIDSTRNEAENEQKELDSRRKEIDEISRIGAGAPCPKCKQELTEDHIRTLKSEFEIFENNTNDLLGNLSNDIASLSREKDSLDTQIKGLDLKEKSLQESRQRLAIMGEKKSAISQKELKLESRKRELSNLKLDLAQEKYAENLKTELERKTKEIDGLAFFKARFDELQPKVQDYELSGKVEEFLIAQERVKRKVLVESSITDTHKQINDLVPKLEGLEKEREGMNREYEEGRQVKQELENQREDKRKLEEEKRERGEDRAALVAQLAEIKKRVDSLRLEIETEEQAIRELQLFNESRKWLDESFVPSIKEIEANRMHDNYVEFNTLFQEYFNVLIETGDISVEINERFAPIVTQQGYDQTLSSLSGGEKTSVALSYRLALNSLVRKETSLGSDLLILDEPTDGFSSLQLQRLQDVFQKLKTTQVIIVSHEQELEGFVDQIVKLRKENGISKIVSA